GDVLVGSRCGNDDFLRTCGQVSGSFVLLGENTGGLNNDVYAQVFPRQVGRIALGEYFDFLAVNDQCAFFVLNRGIQFAMGGVVLEQMSQRADVSQVVDGDNVYFRVVQRCAKYVAANAPKTVDTYFYHVEHPPLKS